MKTASLKPSRRRRTHFSRTRHLLFEGLEDRRLLAGVELISAAHPDLTSATANHDSWVTSATKTSVSADGRYVAFVSLASDLVPGMTVDAGVGNVYRFDRHTGEIRLVSVNTTGVGGANGWCDATTISADGSIVAYLSSATNLHELDTDAQFDVFARNMDLEITHLVSVDAAGTGSGNDTSFYPVISANGSVVAYSSYATNLHALDTDAEFDVYARNLRTGETYLVSIAADGTQSGNGSSVNPVISADGSVVAFASSASNLHPAKTHSSFSDVFVRDLSAGITHLVSVNMDGTAGGNNQSGGPAISADGSVVAFVSSARDLHALATDGYDNVFVRDLKSGQMHLASINASATGGGDGSSTNPAISADGSVVAFQSIASNLDLLDTNALVDIFARNVATNVTHLVSVNTDGTASGNGNSMYPAISADGNIVTFSSSASDLHPLDVDTIDDVFFRDVARGITHLVSVAADGTTSGNGESDDPVISADGSLVAFWSEASNLVARDLNGHLDAFAFALARPATDVTLVGSDLVITDANGGDTNDAIVLTTDGTLLTIQDPNNILATSIPGATGDGSHSITIPLAAFGGAIIFNSLAGDDTLTIDLTGGAIALPIEFHGGTGNNQLRIVGGSSSGVTHTLASEGAGSITLSGALSGVVDYTGVASVTDALAAANRVFAFEGGSEAITLADAAGTHMTIDSTLGASVTFASPTDSLTINAGADDDWITIDSVDASFGGSLSINGGAGNDFLTINAAMTFGTGRHLDLDLTDDAAPSDADTIVLGGTANLVLAGAGAATLKASRAIALGGGAQIVAEHGDIVLQANADQTTPGQFIGLDVRGAGLRTTGSGKIQLTGRGGADSAAQWAYGVYLTDGTIVAAEGTGMVTLNGTGGPGADGNRGISIENGAAVTTAQGNLSVTGAGQGSGDSNVGVFLGSSARLAAAGGGALTLSGTGGQGSNSNHGVLIDSAPTEVMAGTGGLSITGMGQGSGAGNVGLFLTDGARVASTDGGAINVQGTGGDGTSDGYGVAVASGSKIDADGPLALSGLAGSGSAGMNVGVWFTGTGTAVSGNGVTVEGTGGNGAPAVMIDNQAALSIQDSGDLTLVADSMHFGSDAHINAGTNLAFLMPQTPGTPIAFSDSDVPGALTLSDAELDRITAGTLRIGTSTSGPMSITSAINPAGTDTLHLLSGGVISQSSPLTVANLAAEAAGNIGFNLATNDVDVLAAVTSTGFISFGDLDDLTIGTVDGLFGVSTAQGVVNLLSKNLTVSNTAADADVAATGTITLSVDNASGLLTVAAGAKIRSLGGQHTYVANKIDLSGTIEAGSQVVTLRPGQNTQAINLGSSTDTAFNTLELSDAELDRVTAGVLRIGMHTSTSPMVISQSISPAGTDTLHLISGGAISQSYGVAITEDKLAIEAGGPVLLEDSYHQVNTLAISTSSGGVEYRDSNSFVVGTVDGVSGVRTTNGNVRLTSESGNLTIDDAGVANEIEGNFVNLILRGNDAQLTVAAGAQIRTHVTGANLWADKIDLQGSVLAPGQRISLFPNQAGEAINLGSNTDVLANTLELSDAELDRITAGTLVIGRNDIITGVVTVSAAIAPEHAQALSVVTARNIIVQANLTGGDGGLTLSANQQATPVAENFVGVMVASGAIVSATGAGPVQVLGTGGAGSGGLNHGVNVTNSGRISSGSTGTVTVIGTGGAGSGDDNFGVNVANSGMVSSGGTGTVTVTGTGGAGSGGANRGIQLFGSGSMISSGGGNVTVIGQGGGAAGAGNSNYGVAVFYASQITASGTGTVSVSGTGGTGAGQGNIGVYVIDPDSAITSGGGDVIVSGQGGDGATSPGTNVGVYVVGSGQITSGWAGTVTVLGTGGVGSGSFNVGVYVKDSGSAVTSGGGDVSVTGIGTGSSEAVRLESSGAIASGSDAAITITADSLNFTGTTRGIVDSGSGTTTIRTRTPGTLVNLGGADVLNGSPLTLGLTDAELDRVTAGTLQVGDTATGAITLSAVIDPAGIATLHLAAGGAVLWADASAIRVPNLAVESGGSVTLQGSNHVERVAIQAVGDVAFRDLDGFAIDQISGIAGVVSHQGYVNLSTDDGDLLVNATAADAEIAARSRVLIVLHGVGNLLRLANGTQVQTQDFFTETHTLRADRIVLEGMVTVGGGTLHLRPHSPGRAIDLGASTDAAPNTLELSDAELDRITAGVVRVGTETSGPLAITSRIQPTGIGTLHLISGGTIDDGEQGQLIVSQLAVESQGSITLDGYLDNGIPIYHQVGVFAGRASAPGSSLTFVSQGGTVIDTVNGIAGASANGGGVTVITHSPLTVNAPVIEEGGGPIRLVASTDDGVNDHLTINSSVQVLGGSGGVELTAGSDVRITANATSSGSILAAGGGSISIVAEKGIAIDGASITAQSGGSVDLTAGTDIVIQSGDEQATITAERGGSVDLSAGADLVIRASDGAEVLIAADGDGTVAATAGGYIDVEGTVDISTESEPPTLSGTARLTVAVNPTSRLYGQENPPFSVSYAGFAPGHDPSVLSGTLSFSTHATTTSDVGDYAVTASGVTFEGSGLVYEIQFADGVLTVNPAPLTVTVNDAHKVEGDANPTFTVRYDGFVLEQDATVLGGTVSFHTDADQSSLPGTYSIAAEGLSSDNYDITFVAGTLNIHPQVLKLYSISGLVYVDFNNDGEVNFGESGIAGVAITLSGTNDLGQTVEEAVWTDVDGFYKFADLRPGEYHVTENQPGNFLQGIHTAGTLGGVVSAVDQFFLQLGEAVFDPQVDTEALNYNFGERPPADGTIVPGQTAGIGFWQNNNGQMLLQSLNGGGQATQLGDWLAATLPSMFGHLSGRDNTEVGSYFRTLFAIRGQKLEAQVMATALAVYITNASLAGTAGEAYGFVVTQYGVGSRLYNVGTNGAAFGVQDHSDVSVLDLLRATDEMAIHGVLYYSESSTLMKALRNMANTVYGGING